MGSSRRVVVIDLVSVQGADLAATGAGRMPFLSALANAGETFQIRPVFPAVTLPVQASLTTGVYPETHGIIANGMYNRETLQVSFWEQPERLVQAERLWDRLARAVPGCRTAALFMQNILYASCTAVITPKPLHADSGMIPWCYSKPVGLYEELTVDLGQFDLRSYWGPLASIASSRWIGRAAVRVMERMRPDVMLVYLPHLDYGLQRYGPGSREVAADRALLDEEIKGLVEGIRAAVPEDPVFLVLGEYAFHEVSGAVFINRFLRQQGLLEVRTIAGREYLDHELSKAFAMVDHQVAHVYIQSGWEERVRSTLEQLTGIDLILDTDGQRRQRLAHPRSGELVAVSARDRWFAYPWWETFDRAPDFAGQVDIHRKPGYDPLELFFDREREMISQDAALIKGSHGYPPLAEDDLVAGIVHGSSLPSWAAENGGVVSVTAIPRLIAHYLEPAAG